MHHSLNSFSSLGYFHHIIFLCVWILHITLLHCYAIYWFEVYSYRNAAPLHQFSHFSLSPSWIRWLILSRFIVSYLMKKFCTSSILLTLFDVWLFLCGFVFNCRLIYSGNGCLSITIITYYLAHPLPSCSNLPTAPLSSISITLTSLALFASRASSLYIIYFWHFTLMFSSLRFLLSVLKLRWSGSSVYVATIKWMCEPWKLHHVSALPLSEC